LLSSGDGAQAIGVVEAVLPALDGAADPEYAAFAHFLLGAGLQQAGGSAEAAERELTTAAALAEQHRLPHLLARSTFQRGNLLAEAGVLHEAVAAFHTTIRLAHAAGDLFQEVLGYNNAAYHTLLLGEQRQAAELLDAGMALAERHALQVPLQWLFSTAGEVALADAQWEAAEAWFKRSLSEAQHQRNQLQVAGAYAGLGRAALGQGDRPRAQEWLRRAETQAAGQVAYRLQQQLNELRAEASAVTQPHTHLP
jgi:tetratricopeptide (TPR) repeat protein